MYGLFDPSGKTLWLSVDHRRLRPVDNMVLLVHPKDKQEKEDLTECVYKVSCANCDKTYIGETGRKFGVRLQEHRTEV